MNRPIPSLVLPENICRMKTKLFPCEAFYTSIHSEKEANFNSEVEAESAYVPSGPSG